MFLSIIFYQVFLSKHFLSGIFAGYFNNIFNRDH